MKRATSIFGDVLRRMAISIHALVKRATVRTCPRILRSSNFNPRPREEGDVIDNVLESFVIISIHALVKRATCAIFVFTSFNFYFNPRPREEGDSIQATAIYRYAYFNPRPREEGDSYN